MRCVSQKSPGGLIRSPWLEPHPPHTHDIYAQHCTILFGAQAHLFHHPIIDWHFLFWRVDQFLSKNDKFFTTLLYSELPQKLAD